MAKKMIVDNKLLAEAYRISGLKSKEATINAALHEYIQRRQQVKIINLFGSIDFDPKYDHKRGRSRRIDSQ